MGGGAGIGGEQQEETEHFLTPTLALHCKEKLLDKQLRVPSNLDRIRRGIFFKGDNQGEITVRYPLIGLLIFIVGCGGNGQPPKFTAEEQKVIAVAQDYLKKTKISWETPIEVKPPPNLVNVPNWKKYVEEEKNIWKVLFETPKEEMRLLGPRTLFVNMQTNEVTPSVRK